jgi:hypothetical protein
MMNAKDAVRSGHWFTDLLLNFAPYPEETRVTGLPDEMIATASRHAFAISTAAGMIPGIVGIFSILPELIAVTKLQINLIYKLAKFYGKEHLLNSTIIFSIFATAMGVGEHKIFMRQAGSRIVVKAVSSHAMKSLASRLGAKMSAMIAGRRFARLIPFLTAPAFGYFSMAMTQRIAYVADEIFLPDLMAQEAIFCSRGHELPAGAAKCPVCGEEVIGEAKV